MMISLFRYWKLNYSHQIKRTLHYHEAIDIWKVACVCVSIYILPPKKYPHCRIEWASTIPCVDSFCDCTNIRWFYAFARSRTRVYCLEGNYPNCWTTNAGLFCYLSQAMLSKRVISNWIKMHFIYRWPCSPWLVGMSRSLTFWPRISPA